ncbi:hypothetical protein R6Q59_001459 [Mikania micrantha]
MNMRMSTKRRTLIMHRRKIASHLALKCILHPPVLLKKKLTEEMRMLSYGRKVTVLYELLSACLADKPEDNKSKSKRRGKGYDARHRSALRLLTTWFDIKWITMEAIEIIVAWSAMAELKEEEQKKKIKHQKACGPSGNVGVLLELLL